MKIYALFRATIIFCLVAIVIFIAGVASASQTNLLYRLTPEDVKLRDERSKSVVQIEHTPKAGAPLVDKRYDRPILSSKVIRIEKKVRKPFRAEKIIKAGGREFDESDPKAYDKFWAAPLEEKKKYPRTLRRNFVHTRRGRRMKAEKDKLKAENPKEFVKQKRAKPPKFVPYTEEEIEILGDRDRRPTVGEVLASAKSGKVSNQTKLGNKTINLEVQ